MIVVIDAPAKFSKTGKRLRQISKIDEDNLQVHFYSDMKGNSHSVRPIASIIAIYEGVIG